MGKYFHICLKIKKSLTGEYFVFVLWWITMLNGRVFHICLKIKNLKWDFCICFGMDNRLLLTQQHLQWCRQCFWLQRRHLIKVMEKHNITNKKAKTKSTLFRNNLGDFYHLWTCWHFVQLRTSNIKNIKSDICAIDYIWFIRIHSS